MLTLCNGRIKDGPTPVKAPHTRRRLTSRFYLSLLCSNTHRIAIFLVLYHASCTSICFSLSLSHLVSFFFLLHCISSILLHRIGRSLYLYFSFTFIHDLSLLFFGPLRVLDRSFEKLPFFSFLRALLRALPLLRPSTTSRVYITYLLAAVQFLCEPYANTRHSRMRCAYRKSYDCVTCFPV